MKILKFTLILFLLYSSTIAKSQNIIPETLQKLSSPDGAYEFSFYQKEVLRGEMQIYYSLNYKGKPVVLESELGMHIENQIFESALAVPNDTCKYWCENLNFTGVQRSSFDETWKPVYGEHTTIRNNYNEMTLSFRVGLLVTRDSERRRLRG